MPIRLMLNFWLGILFGCRQDTNVLPLTNPLPAGCAQTRSIVHTVSKVTGIVGYYQQNTQLTVSYSLPGTIDSQWTGVVCNLPAAYRVVGKKVLFSGEFRDVQGELKPMFGGQEMYYLYLTAIQER